MVTETEQCQHVFENISDRVGFLGMNTQVVAIKCKYCGTIKPVPRWAEQSRRAY